MGLLGSNMICIQLWQTPVCRTAPGGGGGADSIALTAGPRIVLANYGLRDCI